MTAATIAQQPLLPEMKGLHLQDNAMINSNSNSSDSTESKLHDDYVETEEPAPDEKALLEGPYCRLLGDTEHNWCRAVSSGTGITVLSLLFSKVLDVSILQQAVVSVELQHPRLRSQLLWIEGRPAFKVADHPCVIVEVVDATSPCPKEEESNAKNEGSEEGKEAEEEKEVGEEKWCRAELQDKENHEWMSHVETELNMNLWPERKHCLEPIQMFVVRLYLLPENRSLLVLRVHTAVCDRVAAATVTVDFLKALKTITFGSAEENGGVADENGAAEENLAEFPGVEEVPSLPSSPGKIYSNDSVTRAAHNLMSVEDAIPPGKANKPFWAHGIDLVGYSLSTRRHALLPFDEPSSPRCSKFFHCILSVEETKLLLEACERRGSSLYGVLCAAGMKAAAAIKELGRRSEHFAIISLVNCRQFLEPELSNSTVGFYHSAVMNTHHVNEQTQFWELVKRCSDSLRDSMRNRKHFTDMGDLNYLMFQALQHPGLTPHCSMRTSLLVLFSDPVSGEMLELSEALGIEHYLGCSSIHGVGPSLAIFDSIRNGALHFTGVYPTPLYSRAQMQAYLRLMVDFIVQSVEE